MDTQTTQEQLDEQLKERFRQLPKTIQNAITSADVQKQLRALADTNKLHLDQWQLLENDVMLTLLGFQPTEELAHHLKADLDISLETATSLADDISRIVFQPIREQLERELAHPDAKAANVSGVEAARTQILGEQVPGARFQVPVVAPATPPAEQPSAKIVRAPVSESYKAGEVSSQRKAVVDDPYRESPL